MNRIALIISLLATAYALSGCGNQSPTFTYETVAPSAEPLATVPVEAPSVEDQASLLLALQTSGATAEVVDTVIQDFFTPEGSIVMVNGESIQVFEYESPAAMEEEASQVAPDGGSVGTSMMMWVDAPHFYKAGRIIVLYVGSDITVLGLLDDLMGPQFAGR